MKKYSLSLLALTLVFLLSIHATMETPSDEVKKRYLIQLDQFEGVLASYEQVADSFKLGLAPLEALRNSHLSTRIAYKKLEFIFAFADPQGTKDFINGAPLPSLERNVPQLVVLQPEGLQVLDELVFSNEPVQEKVQIHELVIKLNASFKKLKAFQKMTTLTERQVFEAIRTQLIRILALGITGFDTPGSLNAIPEAQASLEAIHIIYKDLYFEHINARSEKLAQDILNSFEEAIIFTQNNNDFDTFDRLTFIRNYISPLHKDLLAAHLILGVETMDEVANIRQAVNYKSPEIFSENFLNPYYFNQLDEGMNHKAIISLGRTLFFDPVLSVNNKRSCASCHNPTKGFSDGLPKSVALDHKGNLDRNSMTLINSIYTEKFFWDLRAHQMSQQMDHVVHHPKEFGTDYQTIIDKLNTSEEYKQMFLAAFPRQKGKISKVTLTSAIVDYITELSSFNSPVDKYIRGETEIIDNKVKRGFNLFMGKAACGTCHFAPTFSGLVPPEYHESETEVLGTPNTNDTIAPELDTDEGRIRNGNIRESAPHYKYSFKTPTVRNAKLTAPYMHNGVYSSLQEVITFYNKGGGAGMGIDLEHQTLAPDHLNLSKLEQADLIAFMEALTDTTGMNFRPHKLPEFPEASWNLRIVGGEY